LLCSNGRDDKALRIACTHSAHKRDRTERGLNDRDVILDFIFECRVERLGGSISDQAVSICEFGEAANFTGLSELCS